VRLDAVQDEANGSKHPDVTGAILQAVPSTPEVSQRKQ